MERVATRNITLPQKIVWVPKKWKFYGWQATINFIGGKINSGAKNICVVSDYEDLSALAEEGLIEKQKNVEVKLS